MIFQNSFVILLLINCLQTVIQSSSQNVNKRSTNIFQRYRRNVKVLNNYNSTIYFDNILHSKVPNNYSKEIEKAFKHTMAMHGVQYIYKRDFYWRTWRYLDKVNDIIFFKSQSIHPINCTKCQAGFWVIEEKPPLCQYEILGYKNKRNICVLTPRLMVDNKCPKVIPVTDFIRECGNPIRTKVRITYKYTDVSKRNTVFCQERQTCEITTSYSIYPEFIVFQIINSTNHVIYSRIMKDADRNYVYTNVNIKWDLIPNNKNSKIKRIIKSKNLSNKCFNISNKQDKTETLLLPNRLHYKVYNTKIDRKIIQIYHESQAKLSPCKRLQLLQIRKEENYDDFYD